MDRAKKLSDLIGLFQGIMAKYASMEDAAIRLVNVAHPLFKGELHLITCIRGHPEANVTALAKILGVTKGAVSQVIRRLEAKGMILRVGRNKKEFVCALTQSGLEACTAHDEFHKGHFRELERAMAGMTAKEIFFIEKVFIEIDSFYEVFQKRVAARIRSLQGGHHVR